ncbi:hypothetical protein OF83DRAFT_149839 [Amylostereum chailletii]|nr:hypothetical protein OF83DRAFT_149839 [Amylostereum chailletii]
MYPKFLVFKTVTFQGVLHHAWAVVTSSPLPPVQFATPGINGEFNFDERLAHSDKIASPVLTATFPSEPLWTRSIHLLWRSLPTPRPASPLTPIFLNSHIGLRGTSWTCLTQTSLSFGHFFQGNRLDACECEDAYGAESTYDVASASSLSLNHFLRAAADTVFTTPPPPDPSPWARSSLPSTAVTSLFQRRR